MKKLGLILFLFLFIPPICLGAGSFTIKGKTGLEIGDISSDDAILVDIGTTTNTLLRSLELPVLRNWIAGDVTTVTTYAELAATITAAPDTILVTAPITLTNDVVVPSGTRLTCTPGSVITLDGNSLTYAAGSYGPGSNVTWQCFSGTGVTFSNSSPEVHPEWWYASGNYLNAINYAWAAISGTSGKVQLLANTYSIDLTGGVYLTPQPNTELCGVGRASVLSFTFTGSPVRATSNGIIFTDQTHVLIHDLSMVADATITSPLASANGPQSAVWFQPSSDAAVADVTIENCYFNGWYLTGILSYGNYGEAWPHYSTDRIKIDKCTFEDIGGHGVGMNRWLDSSVTNCSFLNIGQAEMSGGYGSGLAVDVSSHSENIIVSHNNVNGAGGGFKCETHHIAGSKLFKTLDGGSSYTDYSTEISGAGDVTLDALDTNANGDYIIIGSKIPFQAIYCDMNTDVNSNASVLTVEYWDGSWTGVTNMVDNTSSAGKTFGQDGAIYWELPSDWVVSTINSNELYYVKLSVSAALSATVRISTVYVTELTKNILFSNNTIKGLYNDDEAYGLFYGFKLSGWNIVCSSNTIDTAYGTGIYASSSQYTNKDIKIINNIVGGTQYTGTNGILVSQSIGKILVSGNTVKNSIASGIYVVSVDDIILTSNDCNLNGTNGIYINGVNNATIISNLVWNNTTSGSGYGLFVNGTCSNLQLIGNKSYDTRSGDARTQLYGLYCPANTVTGVIKNNWFYNNKTAPLYAFSTAYTGIVGERKNCRVGTIAAGTSDEVALMMADGNGIYVMNAFIVPSTAIAIDGTDYSRFSIRNKGTDGSGTTQLNSAKLNTSSTALSAFDATSIGINQNRTVDGGSVLALLKEETNSGTLLDNAVVVIDYISY